MTAFEFRRLSRTWFHYQELSSAVEAVGFDELLKRFYSAEGVLLYSKKGLWF